MNDDIYQIIDRKKNQQERESKVSVDAYDKEEYAARKKAEREDVYAHLDVATQRVSVDPVAFKDYLDVMARFPRYSATNALLVFEQMPNATRLADFDTWKGRKERIKKDASAISILKQGDEYTKDDGSIGTYYDIKKVFDERQTSARHREPRHLQTRELLVALIDTAGVEILTSETLSEGQRALYDHEDKTIVVAEGLSEQELFGALSTELAHAYLATRDDFYERDANSDTAALASYVLCGRYGVDNSDVIPVFGAQSQELSPQEIREELSRIRDASKTISERMDKALGINRGQKAQPETKQPNRDGHDVR
jgi:hypothetical protein